MVVCWPYIFPSAGYVSANVSFALSRYVRDRGLGEVACNNVGVQTEWNPDTVRAPDVMFVGRGRVPAPDDYSLVPDLIVELVSRRVSKAGVVGRVCEFHAAGVLAVFPRDELPRRYTRGEAVELPELFPDFSVPVRALLG